MSQSSRVDVFLSNSNVRPKHKGCGLQHETAFQVSWEGLGGALTCEGGGELDHSWLSAEAVIPTGLTAIIVLVAVQHGNLVGSAEGRARGQLALGQGASLSW